MDLRGYERHLPEDFDYSTPEAQEALSNVTAFILEVRDQLSRRTELYERSFGLAVVPVLLRRVVLRALSRMRHHGGSTK